MASFNNRHWPSMFRSKHAAHQPWQPLSNMGGSPPSLVSGGSTTTIGSSIPRSFPGAEERTPDPKPRWNPRPEQIRILEAIFNSGMVNPPRDEIPRIRLRLQEYGPVGDANVFYWFQNRKARSKNKLRAGGAAGRTAPARRQAALVTPAPLQQQIQTHQQVQTTLASPVQAPTYSSSSSSSDRSSGSSRPAAAKQATQAMSATEAMDLLGPLAAACPQMYSYQSRPVAPPPKAQDNHVAADEMIFLPWSQGYCLSAAEIATILGAQYTHVPVQQQPQSSSPTPTSIPLLGLCNEAATTPTINGNRCCASSWGSGHGQYWPSSGIADHHQLCKNNTAASNTVTKEVAHEVANKQGWLLQYDFGVSAAMDAASVAVVTLPLSASPDAAGTVASSVTSFAAGMTGLAATTGANNGVITNYDQFQGLADDGGGVAGVTGAPAPAGVAATAVAGTAAAGQVDEDGVAVLCIGDSATGRSVVREVAARRVLDVRAQFGEAAVLFRYAGDGERPVHVPVNAASGCTVEPLQHGVVYWVLV